MSASASNDAGVSDLLDRSAGEEQRDSAEQSAAEDQMIFEGLQKAHRARISEDPKTLQNLVKQPEAPSCLLEATGPGPGPSQGQGPGPRAS